MLRILSREGARPQVSRFFFKYVVQSVLLFGAETWVVNPCIRRVLGRFPRPGGADTDWNIPQQRLDGKWKYNSEAAAILEVGFELMNLHSAKAECGCTVYCNTITSGTFQVSR